MSVRDANHVEHSEQIKTIFRMLEELKETNRCTQNEFTELWEAVEVLEDSLKDQKVWFKDALRDMSDDIKETFNQSDQLRRDEEYKLLKNAYDGIMDSRRETRGVIWKALVGAVIGVVVPNVLFWVWIALTSAP